jgi:hypothetical protein
MRRKHAPRGAALQWLQKHVQHSGDECLAWPFGNNETGYGFIRLNGRVIKASRVMCELAHGAPATRDLQAAHSCGNGRKGCVNPRHLRWATQSENQHDRVLHGTSNRGERCGSAVLTRADVMRIRALAGVQRQRDLARHYGVAQATISKIQRGERWAWITEQSDGVLRTKAA